MTEREAVEFRGLSKNREVKIKGERGRFHFQSATIDGDGSIVVTVWGGSSGRERSRTFRADRVVVRRVRGDAE